MHSFRGVKSVIIREEVRKCFISHYPSVVFPLFRHKRSHTSKEMPKHCVLD